MSRQVQLDLVLAGLDVEALEHAVELVDRTRVKAVHEDFRFTRTDLQPQRRAEVVAVIPLRIGVVARVPRIAEIPRVVVRTPIVVAANPDADDHGAAWRDPDDGAPLRKR